MTTRSHPPSSLLFAPSMALVPHFEPSNPKGLDHTHWETVLATPNALVLWQPSLHALSVLPSTSAPIRSALQPSIEPEGSPVCRLCRRPFQEDVPFNQTPDPPADPRYFTILSQANTPLPATRSTTASFFGAFQTANGQAADAVDSSDQRNSPEGSDGYYKRYFTEERRLGMGKLTAHACPSFSI